MNSHLHAYSALNSNPHSYKKKAALINRMQGGEREGERERGREREREGERGRERERERE